VGTRYPCAPKNARWATRALFLGRHSAYPFSKVLPAAGSTGRARAPLPRHGPHFPENRPVWRPERARQHPDRSAPAFPPASHRYYPRPALGDRGSARISANARAQPRLLLLDEPVSGMNPAEQLRFTATLATIRSKGIMVPVVEHDMRTWRLRPHHLPQSRTHYRG
jgi:hypothetical protein